MQPPLVQWQDSMPELVILYVADGRRVTPERVLEVMRADGARFPVVYDPSGASNQRYRIQAYPTAYVIGRDGLVVWEGIPHFNPRAPEAAARAALAAR